MFKKQIDDLNDIILELKQYQSRVEKTYKGEECISRCNISINIFKELENYVKNDKIEFTYIDAENITWILYLYDFSDIISNWWRTGEYKYQLDLKLTFSCDLKKKVKNIKTVFTNNTKQLTIDYLTNHKDNNQPLKWYFDFVSWNDKYSTGFNDEIKRLSEIYTRQENSIKVKNLYNLYKSLGDTNSKKYYLKSKISDLMDLVDYDTLNIDDDSFHIEFNKIVKDIFIF